MQFSKFIFLILILNLLKADGFDTLTYYEKFDVAVQTYKEERYRLSEKYFSSILINDKDYRDPASQLMLAKSQYQQNKWQDAVRSAKSVLSNFPGSPYQDYTLLLMGDIAFSQGKNSEAFQNYLSIRPTTKDSLQLSDIDKRLIICIGNGLKEDRIEGILFREKNPTNRAIINFARAYLSWINGDAYDFSLALNGIDMQVFPQSFFPIYSTLKNTKPISFSRSVTLGVIVPLTGPEKELGQSYLLGLADYLDDLSSVHSIRFLVFDSKGDGVNSLQIVKSLHSNRNIIGILGPLLEEEVLTLAGFKSSLPILIPNSGPPGLSDIAPNLFFLSPSSKTISHRIAQLMITELGFENIAVLSPGDGKLKAMTDHFLEECHQLGVVPVATEWYIEKPENILRQFKSIRKIAWTLLPEKDPNEDAMNLTIDSLDALFDVDVTDFYEIPEEEEKMDRKDSANVVLETIHAMYIPIRQDELTYVGTQFPMYNLKTMLFGNENWLDMTILNQELIGPHVQGMQIISNVNSANTISGDNSISNYHILAMDHGSFVQSIINSGVMNRRQFMDRLRKHSGFQGKQTSIQFTGANRNENGSAQVLEYTKNKMKNIGVYDGTIYSQISE